jgi:hypothetical protein
MRYKTWCPIRDDEYIYFSECIVPKGIYKAGKRIPDDSRVVEGFYCRWFDLCW